MRRHVRKVLFGILIIFLTPTECVDFYCSRSHRFGNAPICGFNNGPV